MKTRRCPLECDHLEARTLLSGSPGHVGAFLHAHAHVPTARPAHVAPPAARVMTAGPVTGGGLVNVPNAPAVADVTALQVAASDNNLVLFLSQFEALSGSNPATQQLALSILNDARNVDMALDGFAGGLAVTLPGNITGNNQALAQQMIAAARGGNVDQAFSSLIVQAEANLVTQLQQLSAGAQGASIRTFATGLVPTAQADLAAAQGTGTIAPVGTSPSSDTLSASDLNTLATYYAINVMERFLGQITVLVTNRSSLALYSAKLIGDHEQGALALGGYAASTATYLPAAIPSSAAPMASSVVAALRKVRPRNTARYDRTYLSQMIMGHTDALKLTAQVIATTQNPTLKQFALNVQPTIAMHLLAAKALMRGLN
ncbi:hypothetical protein OJF2_41190 [Aquisphaera giovannonii]|uniref:DUF4142 domain-containing protein n=1 Tax=Aquisphaera giovannonii TaxID=406548 RepID=A0A5B9W4K2_9BACT|nr:DUF4142 domain-containing protein [Aquisphaera giovannonii]QEH35566.1 hypothetical protein OJF2_41190 [Aquisphaera giovannonii]